LLEGPHHRWVEHLAGLHAELESFHPDPTDQILPAGEEAKARPQRAVFVETGRAEIDSELQRPWLIESRRTNPSTAGIIDIDNGALIVGEPDDRLDRFQWQQVIGHS
jgi:hypothetical protein